MVNSTLGLSLTLPRPGKFNVVLGTPYNDQITGDQASTALAETVLGGEALSAEGAASVTLIEQVARRELAPHACARIFLAQIARRTEGGVG